VKNTLAAAVIAAVLLIALPGAAARADDASDMQDRVDAALRAQPGGTQTDWNEVTWNQGDVILTLAPPTASATGLAVVGGCTSGRFCAYSGSSYTGSKLTYSTCASAQSVAALGAPVRSIANARSSGVILAYGGSTLLASASAGAGSNVSGTTTNISCLA